MNKLRIIAAFLLLAFVAVGVTSCASTKDPCPCLSNNCADKGGRV
ncbi:MAG: hypothetical protein ACJATA_001779 [Sphingobacteriales bacterium]|jgi:hypothetical protein